MCKICSAKKYVKFYTEAEVAWEPFIPGWYFSDECEQLNGPYRTEEEALVRLIMYSHELNGEPFASLV